MGDEIHFFLPIIVFLSYFDLENLWSRSDTWQIFHVHLAESEHFTQHRCENKIEQQLVSFLFTLKRLITETKKSP